VRSQEECTSVVPAAWHEDRFIDAIGGLAEGELFYVTMYLSALTVILIAIVTLIRASELLYELFLLTPKLCRKCCGAGDETAYERPGGIEGFCEKFDEGCETCCSSIGCRWCLRIYLLLWSVAVFLPFGLGFGRLALGRKLMGGFEPDKIERPDLRPKYTIHFKEKCACPFASSHVYDQPWKDKDIRSGRGCPECPTKIDSNRTSNSTEPIQIEAPYSYKENKYPIPWKHRYMWDAYDSKPGSWFFELNFHLDDALDLRNTPCETIWEDTSDTKLSDTRGADGKYAVSYPTYHFITIWVPGAPGGVGSGLCRAHIRYKTSVCFLF